MIDLTRRRFLVSIGAVAAMIAAPKLFVPAAPRIITPERIDLGVYRDGVPMIPVNRDPLPGQYRMRADGTYDFNMADSTALVTFFVSAGGLVLARDYVLWPKRDLDLVSGLIRIKPGPTA